MLVFKTAIRWKKKVLKLYLVKYRRGCGDVNHGQLEDLVGVVELKNVGTVEGKELRCRKEIEDCVLHQTSQ